MARRPLTPEQEELRACVEELDALEREVSRREQPRATETKIIPFEFSQSIIFPVGDMKIGKASYKNGAEDLYFAEPSFVVSSFNDGEVPVAPRNLQPDETGFYGTFDFAWNYAIGSQGENYGSSANDTLWLSRKSLGNRDRWLPLAFRYPLRLKGGDSITFSIKPSYYSPGTTTYGGKIVVNLTLTGVRNGRMAESNFDPEFLPPYRKARR